MGYRSRQAMELGAFILLLSLLVNVSNSKLFLVETDSKEEIKNEVQDNGGADYGGGRWKPKGSKCKCDYIKVYDHAENNGKVAKSGRLISQSIKKAFEIYKRKDENTWTSIGGGRERKITRNNDSTWTWSIVAIGLPKYWSDMGIKTGPTY